jgi:hypothetical protein
MPTEFHAKYYAHELTKLAPSDGLGRPSMSLFDACVDLTDRGGPLRAVVLSGRASSTRASTLR